MNDNIILITGGSKGIGKALVDQLYSENTVIICGRDQRSLDICKKEFPAIHAVKADISKEVDREKLISFISDRF